MTLSTELPKRYSSFKDFLEEKTCPSHEDHLHNADKHRFCEQGCCEWYECNCGARLVIREG